MSQAKLCYRKSRAANPANSYYSLCHICLMNDQVNMAKAIKLKTNSLTSQIIKRILMIAIAFVKLIN